MYQTSGVTSNKLYSTHLHFKIEIVRKVYLNSLTTSTVYKDPHVIHHNKLKLLEMNRISVYNLQIENIVRMDLEYSKVRL